nr:acyltransferase [uncultured Albidiferax sp.]
MNSSFSVYLDLVRILAACFVVYAHSNLRWLIPEKLPLADHAHSAVTVFFVLSGFVISFISERRENSANDYIASRASRILSLSVLAVLLTPVLDMVSRPAFLAFFSNAVPNDHWPVRIAASLAFVCEIWAVSIMTFSNVPYWSLSYEVWYYVLFGLYLFAAPGKRWLWITAVSLFIGPKILLMAPVWLAGVVAYRWRAEEKWPLGLAVAIWLLSVLAFGLYHYFDLMRGFSDVLLQLVGEWTHTHLTFSHYFGADWLLGAIVMLNFMAARRIAPHLAQLPSGIAKAIGKAGGMTFALYIIHFPFLYFWGVVLGRQAPGWAYYAAVISCTVLSTLAFGLLGEWIRPRLRKAITQQLQRYAGRIQAPAKPA